MSFPFLCFDTEDDSPELMKSGKSMFDKQVTQIAAICADGTHWHSRGDREAFKKWLGRRPEKYCYALNIQYDLGNLFSRTLDDLDCTLVGGRMIKAVWGKKIFVDVFNIWFCSVKKLGETFGLKKGELDIHSRDYVFRDVEIIRLAMLHAWEFAAGLGIDELPPTLGSLGVKLWRHWGGETVPHSSELSRAAIFGGRVELFKTCNDGFGKWCRERERNPEESMESPQLPETVAYTDLNSLYPSVMRGEFPEHLEPTGTSFRRLGVVHCTVRVPRCEIAVLPYRNEDGKIYYPWGKFEGVWTVAELEAARARGMVIEKVHASLSTDEGIWPYKTYMERIYQIRLEAKSDPEKYMYKLLMNTLFGRTGSSGKLGRTVHRSERTEGKGVPYGERVLVEYQMPLGEEVNWSHTAYVTSYARLELLRHLELVGAERMIYCDTDSCIFDCPDGRIPFPIGKELGEMKLEGWRSVAVPYAPKMYRVNNDFKAKGVPKSLQREFVEKKRVEYDMPFKFREAVKFYDRNNVKELSVWRRIEKFNCADYDKKIRRRNRFFPCEINDF